MKREQKIAVIIPLLFLVGLLISKLTRIFRYNIELRWIYEYGSILGLTITFFTILWSLIHSIIYIRDNKIKPNKELYWFILGAIPFIYIASCFSIVLINK